MNYIESILWYLTWPLFIVFSYRVIKYFIKKMNYLHTGDQEH